MTEGRMLLAAILFDRGEDPDAAVLRFIAARQAEGLRIEGFVQGRDPLRKGRRQLFVADIATGRHIPVLQDLGPGTMSCRVDGGAIAETSRLLRDALMRSPDLLVVNRFGRLESENGGTVGEIGAAVAAGVPVLICVPRRYEPMWTSFAQGLDIRLDPTDEALTAWWERQALTPA